MAAPRDGAPLRDPRSVPSDAPPTSATGSATWAERHVQQGGAESIRASVTRAEVKARELLRDLDSGDGDALRRVLGSIYLANLAVIAFCAFAALVGDIMHNLSFVRGLASLTMVATCAAMGAHELRIASNDLAATVEKYFFFLATVPGRMAAVTVLAIGAVNLNWIGWFAFWATAVDVSAMAYALATHRWFVDHAGDPALFRAEPPPYVDERDMEIAE